MLAKIVDDLPPHCVDKTVAIMTEYADDIEKLVSIQKAKLSQDDPGWVPPP